MWADVFSIAGASKQNKGGTDILVRIGPLETKLGQRITLAKSFQLQSVVNHENVHPDSVTFENDVIASACLYKTSEDRDETSKSHLRLFYTSSDGPLAPETSRLTPKQLCRVFFANGVKTGHEIDDFEGKPVEIDLTGMKQASIKYNEDREWEIVKVTDATEAEDDEARDHTKPDDGNRENFMGPRGR